MYDLFSIPPMGSFFLYYFRWLIRRDIWDSYPTYGGYQCYTKIASSSFKIPCFLFIYRQGDKTKEFKHVVNKGGLHLNTIFSE